MSSSAIDLKSAGSKLPQIDDPDIDHIAFQKSGDTYDVSGHETVAWYMRQSNLQVPSSKWRDTPKNTYPKKPVVISRAKPPMWTLKSKNNPLYDHFPNVYEAIKKYEALNKEAQTHFKTVNPSFFQRIEKKRIANAENKVSQGTRWRQGSTTNDEIMLQADTLYVSENPEIFDGLPENHPGRLPTRKIELYELTQEKHNNFKIYSKEENNDIGSSEIYLPNSDKKVKARDAGKIRKIDQVACYNFNDFLVFHSKKTGKPRDQRKLMIHAHGATLNEKMTFEPDYDLNLSFSGPEGQWIGTPTNLIHASAYQSYITHKLCGWKTWNGQGKKYFQKSDGKSDNKIKSILLQKFDTSMNFLEYENLDKKIQRTIVDCKETAAWAAHDYGMDILLIKRRSMPTLQSVLQRLQQENILPLYDEVIVNACRGSSLNDPVHGIASNFDLKQNKKFQRLTRAMTL